MLLPFLRKRNRLFFTVDVLPTVVYNRTMQHTITLERRTLRRSKPILVKKQLQRIVDRALAAGRGNRWTVKVNKTIEPIEDAEGYTYVAAFKLNWIGRGKGSDAQLEKLIHVITKAGNAPGWKVQGEQEKPHAESALVEVTAESKYSEVELKEIGDHFAHIYNREAQVRLLYSALRAAVESGFENRFHAVLYGPPASGKTEILNAFAKILGEDAVLRFDCTSTTKAGAEKVLLEAETLPPILLAEEIEKTSEDSLRYMLGLLDHRAEVRKTNYRIGMRQRTIKMLCLATVNDIDLFKSLMDGALFSRFSHKIYCPRPDREVLHRILLREILKPGKDGKPIGKAEWIDPALDYAETEGTDDPRRIVTICLSGGDDLLTGKYQKDLLSCKEPTKK